MNQSEDINVIVNSFKHSEEMLLGLYHVPDEIKEENLKHVEPSLKSLQLAKNDKDEATLTREYATTKNLVELFCSYVRSAALQGEDSLTKIPNRATFDAQLDIALSRNQTPVSHKDKKKLLQQYKGEKKRRKDTVTKETSEQKPKHYFAVCMFDLDRFKAVNDLHDHNTGDAILIEFAEILKGCVRKEDNHFFPNKSCISRIGGDEFFAIFHTMAKDENKAAEIFQRTEHRFKETLAVRSTKYNGKTFPIVTSCGFHMIQADDTHESVLSQADAALDKHKRNKDLLYAYAVEQLKASGEPNLQELPDLRKEEQEEIDRKRFLEAVGDNLLKLKNATGMKLLLPYGTMIKPEEYKALEQAGILVCEEDAPAQDDCVPTD